LKITNVYADRLLAIHNQIKSHLFVSVASIARFYSAIDKISAMKTIK